MEVPGAASVLGEHCLFYLMIERSRKKKTTTKSQNNDNGLPLTLLQTVCRGGGANTWQATLYSWQWPLRSLTISSLPTMGRWRHANNNPKVRYVICSCTVDDQDFRQYKEILPSFQGSVAHVRVNPGIACQTEKSSTISANVKASLQDSCPVINNWSVILFHGAYRSLDCHLSLCRLAD